MPFTPFHFGPSAFVSLPLKRYIDIPIFILANVAIDIEPLLVMTLDLAYPLHGFAHTFVGAAAVGVTIGIMANFAKNHLEHIMRKILRLVYQSSKKKYILSGILGSWFHVLLDTTLYTDIKPFYPFTDLNPFLGLIQDSLMYKICAYAFIPAIAAYILIVILEASKQKNL